jgi:hypothetical protein
MLAEIFFLQLEATKRANSEVSTHAAKFVPFDWTTVPGSKKPRTGAPRGRQEGSQSLGLYLWFLISFDIALEPAKSKAIVFTPLP